MLADGDGISLGDLAPYLLGVDEADIVAALETEGLTLADLDSLADLTLGDLPSGALDSVLLGDLGPALATVTYEDLIGVTRYPGTQRLVTQQDLVDELSASGADVADLEDPDIGFGSMTMGDLLDGLPAGQSITLEDLGSLLDFITVEQLEVVLGVELDAEIAALSETLGDVPPGDFGTLTLLDLAEAFGTETLGALLDDLDAQGLLEGFTLGDLLLALVGNESLALGAPDLARVDFATLPSTVTNPATFTADLTLTGSAPRTIDVEVLLPSGSTYQPGSSTIGGAAVEPNITGSTLTWTILASPDQPYDLSFGVYPSLRIGSASLAAVARVVGTDIAIPATANLTIAEGLEPNDFALVAGERQTTEAAEDVVYLTYVSTPTDIDVFEIEIAENDQLIGQLSNLTADLDVALWRRSTGASGAVALSEAGSDAPLAPVVDPDSGASVEVLSDIPRLDALDQGVELVLSSNNRATKTETFRTGRLPAGTYYVQVYGANGAVNVTPASLQLKVLEADDLPECRAIDPLPARAGRADPSDDPGGCEHVDPAQRDANTTALQRGRP